MSENVINPFKRGFFKSNIFVQVLMLIITLILTLIFEDYSFSKNSYFDSLVEILFYFIFVFFIFVLSLFYKIKLKYFFERPLIGSFKDLINNISIIFYIIPCLYSSIYVLRSVAKINDKPFIETDSTSILFFSFDYKSLIHNLLVLFTTCILAPVIEEIFFRGFVFHRLSVKWNIKEALFVSSLFFGILHGYSFFLISIIGYILALIYLKTKNLSYNIIAHSIYNLLILICDTTLSVKPISDFYNKLTLFSIIFSFVTIFITLPKIIKFLELNIPKELDILNLPYFYNIKQSTNEEINLIFYEDGKLKKSKIKKIIFISLFSLFLIGISVVGYFEHKYSKNIQILDKKVNSLAEGIQKNPSVALMATKAFVVWQSEDKNEGNWNIYAKNFKINDFKNKNDILINQTKAGKQENPFTLSIGKRFLVVWDGNGKGDNSGIYGRYFDENGKVISSEFKINDNISGIQSEPVLVEDKSSCECNFFVVWKNPERKSISIKRYSSDDFENEEKESEIKIPPKINYENIKFSVLNKKILVMAKRENQIVFYQADTKLKKLVELKVISETGFNPNISKSEDGNFIVNWEDTSLDKDLYLLRVKQYDSNLNEKQVRAITKKSDLERFKKAQSYLIKNKIFTIWEKSDFGFEKGITYGFIDTLLKLLNINKDNGLFISDNSDTFKDDSTQINDKGLGEQTNLSFNYVSGEDIIFFVFVWQGYDGGSFDIFTKTMSYSDGELENL